MSIVLTSDDVNLLIYRYLLEAGMSMFLFLLQEEAESDCVLSINTTICLVFECVFLGYTHTAFSFGSESGAVLQERPHAVPQGALVAFLQKGLQLSSIEHHVVEVEHHYYLFPFTS